MCMMKRAVDVVLLTEQLIRVIGLGSARSTERTVKARVARAGLLCDTPGWRARKFRAACAQTLAYSRLERVSVADLAGLPGPSIAAVPLLAQAREGAGGVATLGVGQGRAPPGVHRALVHVCETEGPHALRQPRFPTLRLIVTSHTSASRRQSRRARRA